MSNKEYFTWSDKYRPEKISECILPKATREFFESFVADGNLTQSLMLFGSAGTGKTTVARALCEELGLNYMFINASEENGIDVLRNKIKKFASSQSFGDKNGKPKVVILDEADYLNPQSTQPALRGFMQEFTKSCKFIFTCNYRNKILEPLQSRCASVDFTIPKSEKIDLMGKQLKIVCKILEAEGVAYDKKVVAEVIQKQFPDLRKTLNELQKYARASGNNIDVGILSVLKDVDVETLASFMSKKEFEKVRIWVHENGDNDPAIMYKRVYETLCKRIVKESVPQLVILIADYQYKAAFVADQQINLLACLTEIMMGCEFGT